MTNEVNETWNALFNAFGMQIAQPANAADGRRYIMGRLEGTFTKDEFDEPEELQDEVITPVETVTVTAPVRVATAPATDGKLSNADHVRAYIKVAKENGFSKDSVVLQAMAELGMGKPLATAYVKNNWDKM